jgi:hypothetical protein
MMDKDKTYFSSLFILLTCMAFLSPLAVSEIEAADEKQSSFKEMKGLEVPAIKPGFSKVDKPLEILKRKDLKAIFGKGKDMMVLRKGVDFEKQKVLLFRWNGSGKDSLSPKAEPDPKKPNQPHVVFHYNPGLTKDLRFHSKLYLLPQNATWKVARAQPVNVQAQGVPLPPLPGVDLKVAEAKGNAVVVGNARVVVEADAGDFNVQIAEGVNGAEIVVEAKPVPVVPKPIPPRKVLPPKVKVDGVIRGGIKPAVPIPGRVVNRARSVRIYQQWVGFRPNGAPSFGLPKNGYVLDEETWEELWHAWRPTEKVPEVNFANEMILVGSLDGKTRVYLRATTTEEGQVTVSVNGSGNVKGLSYSFAKVMRAGILSVNGERLPGAPD